MSKYGDLYKDKLVTAEEAAKLVKPGYNINWGKFNNKPVAFDRALAARKDELHDVTITTAVSLPPVPEVALKDPKGETFTYVDMHFSPLTRMMQEMRPNTFYQPIIFSEGDFYYDIKSTHPHKIGPDHRDMMVVRTTPMDEHGYFNWGLSNDITWVQAQHATKHVVVEVTPKMPRCLGGSRESIHISQVSHIIEGVEDELTELPESPVTETDRIIAEEVMKYLFDGCCLQLGIGSMPNTLGKLIAQSDLKDLGGHTEMFVDSFVDLIESGIMNNMRKNLDRGKLAYTFAMGSKRLYEYVHNHPGLASYNVEYINSPTLCKNIDNLISINQALEIDLYCQISAESMGFKQISGNGGLWDFMAGAFWSDGGMPILCLPSTYTTKDGELKSQIVPTFTPGTITTIPRQMVCLVVTEFGSAQMKGEAVYKKAEKLISIAHPDFRDDLIKEAEKMKIWRRTNKID